MKRFLLILMCSLMLTACAARDNQATQPVESTPAETTDTQPTDTLPTDTEADVRVFTVYTPNEAYDGFFTTEVQEGTLTAMEALINAGVLTEDVTVNGIAMEGTHITVDFNSAFADLINTQGTTGERMIMGCVVNTFLSANNAQTMTITVDGEILESGHVVYDFPMEYFS